MRAAASALLLIGALPQVRAAQVEVEVSRDGRGFVVRAVATLHADTAAAFATLTDYERLPLFVPDVREVGVLRREWNADPSAHGEAAAQERLLVNQRGEFRFWWFSQSVEIRLNVVHQNGDQVRAWLAQMPARNEGDSGRLESFAGRYKVESIPGESPATVRLMYDARFEPQFYVPRLIGTHAVRHTLTRQFAAMAEEIERRFAAR